MAEKTACIVIPAYKIQPTKNEIISLLQLKKVLPGFIKYLVIPQKLDASKYVELDDTLILIRFNDRYFKSVRGYSFLCMTPVFYKPFLEYKYMLIYQLDCFVFKNELLDWCGRNFDYIAPLWMEGKWMREKAQFFRIPWVVKYMSRIGNGGFSLRKIDKFYKAAHLTRFISTRIIFHEDVIWSNVVRLLYPGFKLADFDSALAFGFEELPEKCLEKNDGHLPFGCHAWEKYSPQFWKRIIRSHGYEPD